MPSCCRLGLLKRTPEQNMNIFSDSSRNSYYVSNEHKKEDSWQDIQCHQYDSSPIFSRYHSRDIIGEILQVLRGEKVPSTHHVHRINYRHTRHITSRTFAQKKQHKKRTMSPTTTNAPPPPPPIFSLSRHKTSLTIHVKMLMNTST